MEELKELIRHYGIEEDREHFIIPLRGRNGSPTRCFLLKRPFIRIAYPDSHYADFPVEEVIEAIVLYPELSLRESLKYVHKEPESGKELSEDDEKVEERD